MTSEFDRPKKPTTEDVIEAIGALATKTDKLTMTIEAWSTRTEEEEYAMDTFRMLVRHWKWIISVVAVFASVFGLNALKQLVGVPTPVKVEKVDYEYFQQGDGINALVGASGIAYAGDAPTIDVVTPNGTSLSVNLIGRSEWSQLRRADSQSGDGSSGFRRGETWFGVRGDGSVEMPNGAGLHRAIY